MFPPAQKKGMVKFPGKGTLSARQQAKIALLNPRPQALLSLSSKLNVVLSYINVPFCIMQLLSVSFKCKINYYYYFRIFKPFLGLLFEHTLIILFQFF